MIKRYLVLILIMLLTGCIKTDYKSNDILDFHVGIIETTGQLNETHLTFLDHNLNVSKRESIKLGSMGSPFDLPKVYNDYMYVIPKGLVTKDLTVVLEYNLKSGNKKIYDMKQQNMNSFTVDNNFIYTTNTLNRTSIINKCNKSTNEIETFNINDVYISKLDIYDNVLYAFGEEMNNNYNHKSFLYLIDPNNLKIDDRIDITNCGVAQYYSIKINNNIYFTNQYDIKGNAGYKLSMFDTKNKIIENYELKAEFPYQIFEYNNKLIISHYDLVQNKGNNLTIFDPIDCSQTLITLENDIGQIYVFEDKLYSADLENLYVYNLKDFNLEKTIDIYSKRNEKVFYYFSSFFIKD